MALLYSCSALRCSSQSAFPAFPTSASGDDVACALAFRFCRSLRLRTEPRGRKGVDVLEPVHVVHKDDLVTKTARHRGPPLANSPLESKVGLDEIAVEEVAAGLDLKARQARDNLSDVDRRNAKSADVALASPPGGNPPPGGPIVR